MNWVHAILSVLSFIFSNKNDTPMPPQPPTPAATTQREKLYDLAKSCLGKDIAATQNELGCAEAVSYIFNRVGVPGFPQGGYLSTAQFHQWLQRNATQLSEPLPGDVIISPSTSMTHGHIGIVAYHGILSNNSMNGLFAEVYTMESWRHYYNERLKLPVLFYRPLQ